MSKNNASAIAQYIKEQYNKAENKLNSIKSTKTSCATIACLSTGLAIPYSFIDGCENFVAVSAGIAVTSAAGLVISHLVEKKRKKEFAKLAKLNKQSSALMEDYESTVTGENDEDQMCFSLDN